MTAVLAMLAVPFVLAARLFAFGHVVSGTGAGAGRVALRAIDMLALDPAWMAIGGSQVVKQVDVRTLWYRQPMWLPAAAYIRAQTIRLMAAYSVRPRYLRHFRRLPNRRSAWLSNHRPTRPVRPLEEQPRRNRSSRR